MKAAYITAPLVGAFIGYITNFIAIKMLFRPVKAHYIFGMRIPFTPGIIPREKERIAKNIGIAVGEQLLTNDIIIDTIMSSSSQEKIESFIDDKLTNLSDISYTVKELLNSIFINDNNNETLGNLQYTAVDFLYNKLNSPDIIEKISSFISQGVDNYFEQEITNTIVKMALTFNPGIKNTVKDTAVKEVQLFIKDNSHSLMENIVQNEINNIQIIEVGELIDKANSNIPQLKTVIIRSFNNIIKSNIQEVISMMDIASVVEKRIIEYDVLEVEELILSVINKELKAIIRLGAILGFLIGLIMPLIG